MTGVFEVNSVEETWALARQFAGVHVGLERVSRERRARILGALGRAAASKRRRQRGEEECLLHGHPIFPFCSVKHIVSLYYSKNGKCPWTPTTQTQGDGARVRPDA